MHLLTHFGFGWSRTQLWDTLQCKYLQCLCFACISSSTMNPFVASCFVFLYISFVIFLWDAQRAFLCLSYVEDRSRQVPFLPLVRRRPMAGASPAGTWNHYDRCVGFLGWWPTFCLSSFGLLERAASGTRRKCILQRYRSWWQVGRVTSLYLRRMYRWCRAALNDAWVTS